MWECVCKKQFILIYVMALCSIFQGYYVLNVFKDYGNTVPNLNDDKFLTLVGSVGSIFMMLRFCWSWFMDHHYSFVQVYATMLFIQIAAGLTIKWATQSRTLYALWVCMMMLTEGGHFTVIPNAIKQIYGEGAASKVYAILITYTGLCSFVIIFIVSSHFGNNYDAVFKLSSILSLISLTILLTVYPHNLQMHNKGRLVQSLKVRKPSIDTVTSLPDSTSVYQNI